MEPHVSVADAIAHLERFANTSGRPLRLTIRAFNPGALSGHQTVDVEALHCGIDWEAGQVIAQPARPVTWLTPADVDAVRKSVSLGQSWHAYQAQKSQLQKLGQALGQEVCSFNQAVEAIQRLRSCVEVNATSAKE